MTASKPHYRPKAAHRWLRRGTQFVVVFSILVAPLLGGWQRIDNANLAFFDDAGWNLPRPIRDALPEGELARRAYDVNVLIGGGIAGDYLGIPFVDPLAGTLAALRSPINPQVVLAIALPDSARAVWRPSLLRMVLSIRDTLASAR